LVAFQSLLGRFIILHAQADQGFPLWLRNKGIEIINVQFRLEQCRHKPIEVSRINLDYDEFAFCKWKTLPVQKVTGTVRVVHYGPDDGAVGGIKDHEGEDVHAIRVE